MHPDILYEDLCFDCQQAVEKVLKSLLRYYDLEISHTHSIGKLLSLLEDDNIEVPDNVKEGVILTEYAVQTRYPGDYEPVLEAEYKNILKITNEIFHWVVEKIEK